MKWFLLAPCALAALTVPAAVPAAHAQAQPAEKPHDPEAFAAALALFDGEDLEEQLRSGMMLVMEETFRTEMEGLRANGMEMPADLQQRLLYIVTSETEALVKELIPTFRAEAAAIYAARFTAEELRELKVLQAYPVMRKMEREAAAIMIEMGRIGQRAAEGRMGSLERRLQRMIEQWQAEQPIADAVSDT